MSPLKSNIFSAFSIMVMILLTTGVFLFNPQKTVAQDKTWTGSVNSNWHTAGNWSPTGVPGSSDDVFIVSNSGNPFPIISTANASVANLQIGDGGRTGELTVSDNRTLTISDGLRIDQGGAGGTLFIASGGAVDLTGGTFTMTFNKSQIQIDNGSFSSDVDVTIGGDGLLGGENVDLDFSGNFNMLNNKSFSLESGSVNIGGNATINGPFNLGSGVLEVGGTFQVNSNKTFEVEQGDVTIQGTSIINGTYNGDDGITNFNSMVTVSSGGVINLDSGEIYFNNGAQISNNGTANLGSGIVGFEGTVNVQSGGYLNVQDATVNVTGDADFSSNGNLSVDDGSINILGNASLSSGGSFDLNNGSFNVGGNASFTNGGTVNAGNSQIDLAGNLTLNGGGSFNSGTSTVTFSGTDTQTINTSGQNITFHNVVVQSGATIQTDGSGENTVTVENDMTVENGGQVNIQGEDNLDVQGDLDDQGGGINSPSPYVVSVSTPSLTSVVITFNKAMDETRAENTSNYSINNGISVNNATLNASDATKVTLTVSTLTSGSQYQITMNNLESTDGGTISTNNIKNFTVAVQVTYYSRTSGNWNSASSWSTQSHTGSAASSTPNAQNGNKAQIGNSHTITVASEQDITNMDEINVENSGILEIAGGGTLVLENFIIEGNGTFTVSSGGSLSIGSPDGIGAEGISSGNIQTVQRNFGTQGNYLYTGSSAQETGSGLPQQVNDLRVDNASGVTAMDNIQVDGTLYLDDGSLIITSGQSLIANTKSITSGNLTFYRILSGSQGWRMISSPIDAAYSNFLSGILTQGYSGAQYDADTAPFDTLQPNILYYDETFEGTDNQRWRAPTSASASVLEGRGYFAYLFGDVASDNRYNDPLPDTLVVQGQENEGSGSVFNFNATFTAEADSGWNLVGNPFGAAIDWDDTGNWTRTNIDNTIYVWDPEDGEYKTWNSATQTGSMNDGIIQPFQAFWIKANDQNPVLSVNEAAKTFGGTFIGGASEKLNLEPDPKLELMLSAGSKSSRIYFNFTDDALIGKDPSDAYLLQPPPGLENSIQFYSIGENDNRFVINALPRRFGVPIEIPISARVFRNGRQIENEAEVSFSSMQNIPDSWEITLVDRTTGETISINTANSVSFKTSGTKNAAAAGNSKHVLAEEYKILADADPDEARFLLRISPGADADDLPTEVELKPNYPNPFSSNTTIPFKLPIQEKVTIEIYDVTGRLVDTVVKDKIYNADQDSEIWAPQSLSDGVYIIVLKTRDKRISRKITYIK